MEDNPIANSLLVTEVFTPQVIGLLTLHIGMMKMIFQILLI